MTEPLWRKLILRARDTELATLDTELEACGACAVTIEAADAQPLFDTLETSEPLFWPNCRVEALFDAARSAEAILAELAARGVNIVGARFEVVAEQDWQQAFRAHFVPLQFGRLWVVPSWHQVPPGAEVALRLDPGMAFGTGTHPTTALCLAWLAEMSSLSENTVLDYGCGSGILAIAAAKLGARKVAAVDIDPAALQVTRENAALNGGAPLDIGLPAMVSAAQFEVLVANLLLKPVLALVADFARLLVPGGRLAVSGILVEQLDLVRAAYAPYFKLDPPRQADEWALLSGVRLA
jgi:ribosomal protein L11 methyltransferase